MHILLKMLEERSEGVVKADADAGDANAALDYGVRSVLSYPSFLHVNDLSSVTLSPL